MPLPCGIPCLALIFCFFLSCYTGAQQTPATGTSTWKTMPVPFRPVNVTAIGGVLFVCGADEMILSSKDNGMTWETKHQTSDGEVLLTISFVDEKVGYVTGTGGLLLSTVDGGQSWKTHHAPDSIRSFSFADASNGIAVFSDSAHPPKTELPPGTTSVDGSVKITHDGGDHWDDMAALNSNELRPFMEVLSIAALDNAHDLMLRRQPNVEDAFVTTNDGGKSWKLVHMQNDASNRVMARTVFTHQGEYWAFGMELVHREKGGGYSVPLAMHSKDGETWIHGNRGPNEFGSCTAQGCYLWDGALEVLYGEHEQFWALPQDGTLNDKWAIAGATVCAVNNTLKCASATSTEKPQPHPEGVVYASVSNGHFSEGCLECRVDPIVPDNPGSRSMSRVQASVTIHRDGSVANVSVKSPSKRMNDLIADQLSKWLFEPTHQGGSTIEVKRDISILLMCAGFPERPETDRCSLHSPDEFSRPTN
jgi:photosystem II stability/assembly factor-like uncharacterized protein